MEIKSILKKVRVEFNGHLTINDLDAIRFQLRLMGVPVEAHIAIEPAPFGAYTYVTANWDAKAVTFPVRKNVEEHKKSYKSPHNPYDTPKYYK